MQINFSINIDDNLIRKIRKFFNKKNSIIAFFLTATITSAILYAAVEKPYNFNEGDTIYADQINENFDTLYSAINTLGGNESIFSTGMIMPYIGNTAPNGWLICDGSSFEEVDADTSALYTMLGDSWYTPDLRGRYIIGRIPSSATIESSDTRYGLKSDAGGWITNSRDTSEYSWRHELQDAEMPDHFHTFSDYFHNSFNIVPRSLNYEPDLNTSYDDFEFWSIENQTGTISVNHAAIEHEDQTTNTVGNETPYGIPILPPSMALNFIIKI